jgi:glucosamine--fructose-6-phosphate aminotransferase (isomerizing)
MCGVVGIVSDTEFSLGEAFARLKKLEYRGYDSFGYYDNDILIRKTGHIQIPAIDKKTKMAILHTRWATHGGISEKNAHPHQSCNKEITIVHNGIIENYEELRKELTLKGHKFASETDSEVIAHYFEEKLGSKTMEEACRDFFSDIRGTFAVLMMQKGDDKIYALKRDSPLVLGIADAKILASDIYAFSDISNRAIVFDDDEYAIVDAKGCTFFDRSGKQVQKLIGRFEWSAKEEKLEQYEHFMIKEIKEQPEVAQRLLNSFGSVQKDKLKRFAEMIRTSKRVVFLACGTSYHASLVGAYLLTKLGVEAHSVIASEFEHFLLVDKDTLVVPISQSGETMDVVTVLKDVRKKGAKVASIVNVPYSTVQRLSDVSIEILAGQEICVAATKSYTNQLITLFAIAKELGNRDIDFGTIQKKIQDTIERNEEHIKKLAKSLYKKNDIFVLGRGISYPTAREIALKLKEIPYMHAEGMMAGELKHGTIALIENGTPVICLVPNKNTDMMSSTKEVEARGARVILVSNTNGELHIPSCSDAEFAVYAGLVGHLLSYYVAKLRGCEIDKPRNLAKSVTVK